MKIIIRGDSGFCRENNMIWCEDNDVDFLVGLAKKKRHLPKLCVSVVARLPVSLRSFVTKTLQTWCWNRGVVGKAEYLAKGAKPRFAVTS
jgi:hypothetical protein